MVRLKCFHRLLGSLGTYVTAQAKGWAKMETPLWPESLIKNEKINPINALCKEKSG